MIKLINKVTGTEMFVAESRVEEYLAAGHKLAAEPAPVPKEEPKPKKTVKKKK